MRPLLLLVLIAPLALAIFGTITTIQSDTLNATAETSPAAAAHLRRARHLENCPDGRVCEGECMPRDAVCHNRGSGTWCADKRVRHPAKGCCEKGWTDCQNRCMPSGAECCGDGIACARD